jgi:predicted nucleic acid-binding protein
MRIFFDSSAFAKRYVPEEGTDAVVHWCDRTAAGLKVTAV